MKKKDNSWANILEPKFDPKKQKREEDTLIFGIFILLCSMLYSFGSIGGLLIKSFGNQLILAVIFLCIVRCFLRIKLKGRMLCGGAEKPWLVSFGATLLMLGSMLASHGMKFSFFSISALLAGIYLFYRGVKEGPFNGWDHYFRSLRGEA